MMAEICRSFQPTIEEATAISMSITTDDKVTKNAVFQQINESPRDKWLVSHNDLPEENETFPGTESFVSTDTDNNGNVPSIRDNSGCVDNPGDPGTIPHNADVNKGCISIDEIGKAIQDVGLSATRPRTRNKEDIYFLRPIDDDIAEGMTLPPLRTFCNGLIAEGTTTILFSSTNVGKSPLAVQFAEEIARTDKVLYLDTELSERQVANRYSDGNTRHIFGPNLFRKSLPPKILCQHEDRAQWLLDYILYVSAQEHINFFIIDNMTTLIIDGTKGDQAGAFMQKLMSLKLDHQITTIVVGHTPKLIECKYPITLVNLYGSAKFSQASDNVLALSRSIKGPNKRYLKQLKVRDVDLIYTEDNVLELDICKTDGYLHFEPCGCSPESEHLRGDGSQINGFAEKEETALIMLEDYNVNGLTERALADKYRTSKSSVHRSLELARKLKSSKELPIQDECETADNKTELFDDNLPY